MKKTLLLSLTIGFLFHVQTAKTQPSPSAWLTANAGINSIWLLNQNSYGNPEMEYGTKFGLSGDIGLNYYLNNKYGFSTGIGLGNFGQSYVGEQAGEKATRKVNLNYIKVPVMGMKQLSDPQHPCWLSFGPEILILTSASQKYTRVGGSEGLPNPGYFVPGKHDVTKWYKPMDIMLKAEVTNIYYMGTDDSKRFMLSVMGAFGLMDVNSNDPKYHVVRTGQTYKGSHNFYLGVKAGIMFNP
ncbi:MAG: outer membrane beta-barrel protein [Bacteroidetes bacterium]|nr:outer membrane beta-barrel protein [Bacteroidota bacterium]